MRQTPHCLCFWAWLFVTELEWQKRGKPQRKPKICPLPKSNGKWRVTIKVVVSSFRVELQLRFPSYPECRPPPTSWDKLTNSRIHVSNLHKVGQLNLNGNYDQISSSEPILFGENLIQIVTLAHELGREKVVYKIPFLLPSTLDVYG